MNIENLLPETDLKVYKVTNILTDGQMKLLTKLVEGKLNTGYRKDEVDQAIADIRKASVDACQTIFEKNNLVAKEENKHWPWFDLSMGESRDFEHSGTFADDCCYLAEFVLAPCGGGEIVFEQNPATVIDLAPGEMLVASRQSGHEFQITPITSGQRFTLLTHVNS